MKVRVPAIWWYSFWEDDNALFVFERVQYKSILENRIKYRTIIARRQHALVDITNEVKRFNEVKEFSINTMGSLILQRPPPSNSLLRVPIWKGKNLKYISFVSVVNWLPEIVYLLFSFLKRRKETLTKTFMVFIKTQSLWKEMKGFKWEKIGS